MTHRLSIALVAASVVLAQTPKSTPKPFVQSRTSDGQPDLEGFWTNPTITPFERAPELGTKAFLTADEAAKLEKQAAVNRVDRPPAAGDVGAYNQAWFDSGT
jgi:hypothetical protein